MGRRFKLFGNSLMYMKTNGKNIVNSVCVKHVRRIHIRGDQLWHINRIGIGSLNRFVRLAIDEKLERDFKVKFKSTLT